MAYILIAEDDTFLANAYRVKLTQAGFEIKIVADGQQTLDAIKQRRPDLLILDIIMPQLDGFAVLEQLMADPQLKTFPVIVASNLGQKEDLDKSKKLGADDYIIKADLSLEQLVERVKKLLPR